MAEWRKYLPNLWSLSSKRNFQKKESQIGSLLACGLLGNPLWTPRRYDKLAEEGFQKNVVVYRCVTLIARSLASVPWLLYERKKDGEHELEKHPLLSLLTTPSPKLAGTAFIEALVGYLLLAGNTYVEGVFNPQGFPQELYPLRPDRIRIIPGANGLPEAFEYSVGNYKKRLPVDPLSEQSSVLHLKLFNPLHDWYGMSPLEAASGAIDQHNAVAGHNLALLQNGGRPSGALMIRPHPHQSPLTQEQRQNLRQDLREVYEGTRNAGRIIMLEGDFEWKEMGLSPKDLDFIEGKNLSAREIAQAFGVPPMLAGVPGDATFANYREARLHLWEDTIIPLLEFLVAEFNLWLSPYFGENLRLGYDIDSIPALSPKREAVWNKIMKADFLTVNEKRQAVGYGPLPEGGDQLSRTFNNPLTI